MLLSRKVLITCDIMVELPSDVEPTDSFEKIEKESCQSGINRICAALAEGQKHGISVGCKFDVRNPRMKVMFLNSDEVKR